MKNANKDYSEILKEMEEVLLNHSDRWGGNCFDGLKCKSLHKDLKETLIKSLKTIEEGVKKDFIKEIEEEVIGARIIVDTEKSLGENIMEIFKSQRKALKSLEEKYLETKGHQDDEK